ncbi:MBL fold metallo-hydrolase [Shewanella waksmanii]|uniref:MBL fold metallo-hydrolase n=1 Tax=Shewanella waksmanii TaxID=213783 RepID=UPI000562C408|nr:MBL fold metallo-hydrolase [Shewanella waksmanii]
MLTANLFSSTAEKDLTLVGAHHTDKGFQNTAKDFSNDTAILPLLGRYITEKRTDAAPLKAIPVITLQQQDLLDIPVDRDTVIRLGHSTIYLQIAGQRWLIDPVFSERASPFSFVGPKRFHQPPIALSQLPDIDGVLISHDHYDHLDKDTIAQIQHKVQHFVVPLGVDKHLLKWQVPAAKITALDWWQSAQFDKLNITATPTQHFSGRGLLDRDETLWASYVIKGPDSNVYFSGDPGYFDGFKEIGRRYGPFDLTMIETGAYDKDWSTIHMSPQQSFQAHQDLGGNAMMPIHNGTFDLAFHSWYEPLARIQALISAHNDNQADTVNKVQLLTPKMGQTLAVNNFPHTQSWWKNLN